MINKDTVVIQEVHAFNRTRLWSSLMRDIRSKDYSDNYDLERRLKEYQLCIDCNDGLLRKQHDFWIRDYEENTVSALFTLRQYLEGTYINMTALESVDED